MTERRVQGPGEWLYVFIVAALGLYLVIGIVAWSWMIIDGIEAPGGFVTVLSTIAGGFIGILAPIDAPGSRSRQQG